LRQRDHETQLILGPYYKSNNSKQDKKEEKGNQGSRTGWGRSNKLDIKWRCSIRELQKQR
jgi:hypothetical protein